MNAYATYLKFVKLADAIEIPCDPSALKILDAIAISEKVMKVSDVMRLIHLGSPATIHRKLSDLIDDGMVELKNSEKDHRTKFVHLTADADRYFHKLGSALIKALKDEK